MNKPAFLVDGFTEKLVLEKLCPNSKINRINCNGSSVSLESIAKRVVTLIKIMNNRHYPIIVVIDREDREMSAIDIRQKLSEEIKNAGVTDDVRIGVCDRMIENWILSDWESYAASCKVPIDKPETCEGLKGKSFIKRTYPAYQETTDGVNMLLSANPKSMYGNSESFRDFVHQVEDVNCNWLASLF